jgi:uncharacterized membrane protein (DUF4010 family)
VFDTAKLFLLSLALGLLVGIERERARAKDARGTAFGARTLALVALLGTLAAHLGAPVAVVMAAFVAALTVATYFRPSEDGHHDAGTTTEVAAVLTFGLGWLAHQEPRLAAMLGVIVVLVLWLKPRIHAFAHEELTNQEVNAALLFLVIALVVLPLLPDRAVDPWGVINPSRLWLMFTLIAGVGFAGYIAVRALGPARGLATAGFFAGLVSSTAATLSLARRAKGEPEVAVPLATGIVLANAASASAQALVVGVSDPALLRAAVVLVGAPVAVGVLGAVAVLRWRQKDGEEKTPADFRLSNPLEVKPALVMAAAFGGVLLLSAIAQRRFGDSGVLVTAGLAGTTDVHAATLAAATLAASGTIEPAQALLAMLIAFLVNMAVKLSIVAVVGTRRLFFIVAPPLLAMVAAAIGAYLLVRGRV